MATPPIPTNHSVEKVEKGESVARYDIEQRPLVHSSGTDVVDEIRCEQALLSRHGDRR
jgi:hypothetical protein